MALTQTVPSVRIESSVHIETEEGFLHYDLLKEESVPFSPKEFATAYSLLITAHKQDEPAESVFFYDLTRLEEEAALLLRRFSEGAVLPCQAAEVLEDLLGQ